jgi:post-segregation antitoxin (ccd killing protein)
MFTEKITLKITPLQKHTLDKLRNRNIKVSDFIRKAIAEKIKKDAKELIVKKNKDFCPF